MWPFPFPPVSNNDQPRRGERIQPTAQAVGWRMERRPSPGGAAYSSPACPELAEGTEVLGLVREQTHPAPEGRHDPTVRMWSGHSCPPPLTLLNPNPPPHAPPTPCHSDARAKRTRRNLLSVRDHGAANPPPFPFARKLLAAAAKHSHGNEARKNSGNQSPDHE
jgi:hypothetical protein